MRTLSRYLRLWEPVRVAGAGLALAGLIAVAGYVVGAVTSQPTVGGVVAAAGFLAIAGSGFLYAWRPGAGGILD